MLEVLYLVPNLGDAAVARRVAMLREGGAHVSVAGFERAGAAEPGGDAIVLGRTFDARFSQRILEIARAARSIRKRLQHVNADVIVARNLEMLFLASRLRGSDGKQPAVVYECLDIHRLLLRPDAIGRSLRRLEQRLAIDASLVLTSSPAFVREYFDRWWRTAPPMLLVENKVLDFDSRRGGNPALRDSAEAPSPIRIGWFGALRCRKSLTGLAALAAARPDRVEIVLRGRPARHEFEAFDEAVSSLPNLSFKGPYRNPGELSAIYSDVHLSWAIDLFEAGQNSDWLLPNRIYEGCLHGAVPIALAGTETAAFLARHDIGIVLPDIAPKTLTELVDRLDAATLGRLAAKVAALPRQIFADGPGDCRALVEKLAGAARPIEAAA